MHLCWPLDFTITVCKFGTVPILIIGTFYYYSMQIRYCTVKYYSTVYSGKTKLLATSPFRNRRGNRRGNAVLF